MNTKFIDCYLRKRALHQLLTLPILLLGLNAVAKVEAVIGPVPLNKNLNLAIPMPQTNESEIVISRDQYVISYNKNRRAPNWVAWKLETQDIGSVGRRKDFSRDPDLEKYLAQSHDRSTVVEPDEYRSSCFDRGHQVPSKDRTDSVPDNEKTFLTSNIVPQTTYLNQVIWEHLERHTRDLVLKQGKKAYVIAGPVYDEDFGSIGPKGDIPVPSKDFKIIIVLNARQTPADINENTEIIAAMMPNVHKDGSKPTGANKCIRMNYDEFPEFDNPKDWEKYKTTIADIERTSGIRFALTANH